MKAPRWIIILFLAAAAYDALIGLLFLTAGVPVLEALGITPPNHPGYLQFPAALLLIFGFMFFNIAANPVGHRQLIGYGLLLKAAYCGVVFYHWFGDGIPWIWKPFCIADLAFFAMFIRAWFTLGRIAATTTGNAEDATPADKTAAAGALENPAE